MTHSHLLRPTASVLQLCCEGPHCKIPGTQNHRGPVLWLVGHYDHLFMVHPKACKTLLLYSWMHHSFQMVPRPSALPGTNCVLIWKDSRDPQIPAFQKHRKHSTLVENHCDHFQKHHTHLTRTLPPRVLLRYSTWNGVPNQPKSCTRCCILIILLCAVDLGLRSPDIGRRINYSKTGVPDSQLEAKLLQPS